MIGGPDIKRTGKGRQRRHGRGPQSAGRGGRRFLALGRQAAVRPQADRPKAAELGVSIADITNTLRLLVAGDKVSDYNDQGEQYEVHVRSIADAAQSTSTQLKMVTVPSSKFGPVPLADVIHFEPSTGPAQINRFGAHAAGHHQRKRHAGHVGAGGSRRHRQRRPRNSNLGPDYQTGLLGKSKEMAKAFRGFFIAFILAFIFVYLCIAAQFESWLHPITILLSLAADAALRAVSLYHLPPVDRTSSR